jgi:ABC-2 type transport system permease protein
MSAATNTGTGTGTNTGTDMNTDTNRNGRTSRAARDQRDRRDPRDPQAPLPGVWRIALSRGHVELKSFFRERQSVIFILAMPAVMLVLLGAIFGKEASDSGVTIGDLYVAGIIGAGVMASSYQNLGISIAFERERFTLKRLRGTPMPPAAYFAGKIIQVIVAALAEIVVLVIIGLSFYHLRLPTSLAKWWTFTWVFFLGVAACSLLGIAASSVPRSAARNGVAVITLPFVILQFISGVYVPFNLVPSWLADIASFFPLAWLCRGMRSVFVPQAIVLEPGHSWELGQTALVLTAWIVAGLVLCLTTFRWQNRRDR